MSMHTIFTGSFLEVAETVPTTPEFFYVPTRVVSGQLGSVQQREVSRSVSRVVKVSASKGFRCSIPWVMLFIMV